jgi:2-dehydro-3-deoxyphosphooctonate aldolase (KDO 8-P synthase)
MILCGHAIAPDTPLFAIAGPCVIESEELTLSVAETLAAVRTGSVFSLIFKSSFDKANRSSDKSFRGLGMDEGLRILEKVRAETGLPVITDVHEPSQVAQWRRSWTCCRRPPSSLVRRLHCGRRGLGQSQSTLRKRSSWRLADMKQVIAKARNAASAAGQDPDAFLLCERGTSFGYNTLVSDMRGLAIMAETGCPVVFDATHSVQQPGGLGERSGGQREYVPLLARAGGGGGSLGPVHGNPPQPDKALSDGPNALPLDQFEPLLARLQAIDAVVKGG